MVTVYRHVKRLTLRGLLFVERSAVTTTGKPYDLYRCPLESAGLTVSQGGIHVHWKTHHTMGDRLHGLWRKLEERT